MQRLPDTGHIEVNCNYRLLTEAEKTAIYEWCEARAALGNQKEFAARRGLSIAIVQVYAAKWRASKRWRRLANGNIFERLLAEDNV